MQYTHIHQTAPVHVATIAPLSPHVVRIKMSVHVFGYPHNIDELEVRYYAEMLLTGTEKRTKRDIETYLKKYGISLSVIADGGTLHFTLTAERPHIERGIALLEEMIFHPSFDAREFKNRKQTLIEANREAHDDAKLIAHTHFLNMLYPSHSYFRAMTLSEEKTELLAITLRQLQKCKDALEYGEWFITACDTGVSKRLSALISRLRRGARSREVPESPRSLLPAQNTFSTVSGKTNVELRLGNTLPITSTDDDFIPFMFGLSVLGKPGSFSGRLMSTVREKEGLTYGIYARISNVSKETTGHWFISTFFTAKDLRQGITSTMREMNAIAQSGITKSELETFKEILVNQRVLALGSDTGRLRFFHTQFVDYSTVEMIHADLVKIESLTQTKVNTSIAKFLDPTRVLISGAGPVMKDGKGIL